MNEINIQKKIEAEKLEGIKQELKLEEERAAIERGLRAIVTFQERIGEEPLKREISEIEKTLEEITTSSDVREQNISESDKEFNKIAILRDQELELHFQHLKIEVNE